MVFKILFTKKFYNFIFKKFFAILFFFKKGFIFLLNKLIFIFYLKNDFHIEKKWFSIVFTIYLKNNITVLFYI